MSEKKATRDGYAVAIAQLVSENEKVVVFDADLSGSTKSAAAKKVAPERHFNAGIAENNMTGMAAGMAASGFIPFISTFAVFGTGRNYDFIRNAVCYPNLNVKLALTHAGLTVGQDGATHQMLEDVALMNALPNMKVIVPADYYETIGAIKAAAEIDGPVYVRMGREPVEMIYDQDHKFTFGKADVLKNGSDVSLFACGIMVQKALEAAEMLKAEGIDAEVINVSTIKPLDKDSILASIKKTVCAVVCEEHSVYGGLCSVISELCAQNAPIAIEFVAVNDHFGASGTSDELLSAYGLTAQSIVQGAKKAITRK